MLKTAILRPGQGGCGIFGKAIAKAIVAMKPRRKFPVFAAAAVTEWRWPHKKAATSKKSATTAPIPSLAACANPPAGQGLSWLRCQNTSAFCQKTSLRPRLLHFSLKCTVLCLYFYRLEEHTVPFTTFELHGHQKNFRFRLQ
jgi:hypothetical protein